MKSDTRWHWPLLGFAALMALLAIVSAVGLVVDDRTITGSPAWFKPLKFSISFVLYALALAWMLTLTTRGRRVGWWAGLVAALAGIAEMVAIVTQVVRGRPSHFNNATAFDDAVFSFMGNMVVLLWLATLVLAIVVCIQRQADPATALGIRFGIGLSLAGMMLGFLMTQPTKAQQQALDSGATPPMIGSHSVGAVDGGPSMVATGWSTVAGDLRVPHFVGIHALQFLPVLALLLAVLARRTPTGRLASPKVRVRLMWIASFGYAALITLLTWQALRGQSVLHPDALTLGVAGGLTAVGLAAVGLAAAVRSH